MAPNMNKKRLKRSPCDDSLPPPSSSSSPYGPPPQTEDDYLRFCLILLAHGGAMQEEIPVARSATEMEPEFPSSTSSVPVEVELVTAVAPKCPSPFEAAPLEAIALRVHKTSHLKDKLPNSVSRSCNNTADDGKPHERSKCHRVFSALGGNKRRHFEGKNGKCQRLNHCRSAVSGKEISVVNLFDLNKLPVETTTEEDDLLCWETVKVLGPISSARDEEP